MKKLLLIAIIIIFPLFSLAEDYDCSNSYFNDERLTECTDCEERCGASSTYNACIYWCEGNNFCKNCGESDEIENIIDEDDELSDLYIVIEDIDGDVEIYQKETGKWATAYEQDTLYPGDMISTGFESEAIIRVKEIALVTVKEMTEFRVSQFLVDGDIAKTTLELKFGSLRSKVQPEGRMKANFEIVSPTSTAGVRGTDFTISHDEDKKITELEVHEGTVNFADEDGSDDRDIKSGEKVSMGEDGKIIQDEEETKKGKATENEQKDNTPLVVWIISGIIAVGLFIIGLNYKKRGNKNISTVFFFSSVAILIIGGFVGATFL